VPAGGGSVELSGRLGGAADDLQPGGTACTAEGGAAGGADVVYSFTLEQAMGLDAFVAGGFTAQLYLLAGCGAAEALARMRSRSRGALSVVRLRVARSRSPRPAPAVSVAW